MAMKIIARQTTGQIYLLQTTKDKGSVVDVGAGKRYLPVLIQSILLRGYWTPYNGNVALIKDLMNVPLVQVPKDPLRKNRRNGVE